MDKGHNTDKYRWQIDKWHGNSYNMVSKYDREAVIPSILIPSPLVDIGLLPGLSIFVFVGEVVAPDAEMHYFEDDVEH